MTLLRPEGLVLSEQNKRNHRQKQTRRCVVASGEGGCGHGESRHRVGKRQASAPRGEPHPVSCEAAVEKSVGCAAEASSVASHLHFNQKNKVGLPWWLRGEESACQCRRLGFDPRSEKIPRATEQLNPCAKINK